jgi:hypothetical protein
MLSAGANSCRAGRLLAQCQCLLFDVDPWLLIMENLQTALAAGGAKLEHEQKRFKLIGENV